MCKWFIKKKKETNSVQAGLGLRPMLWVYIQTCSGGLGPVTVLMQVLSLFWNLLYYFCCLPLAASAFQFLVWKVDFRMYDC